MADPVYHEPVLVDVAMSYLEPSTGGLYLDGTLGGGGHTEAILEAGDDARVVATDRDPEAIAFARRRLARFGDRVRFLQTSFEQAPLDPRVAEEGLSGALLDLGVSSYQLDRTERGFTLRHEAPLDMRMDPAGGDDARTLLASLGPSALAALLRAGDAPRPGSLARRIVGRRDERPLRTSDDLVGVLESELKRPATHAEKARLFQALRIAVNDELGSLERALPRIRDTLRPGGAFVVIAYHSLEDGLVKRAFRDWSDPSRGIPAKVPLRADELTALGVSLTRKPVRPGPDEVEHNPRARPARLRAWRKAA